MKAVVWTDAIQGIIYLGGVITVLVVVRITFIIKIIVFILPEHTTIHSFDNSSGCPILPKFAKSYFCLSYLYDKSRLSKCRRDLIAHQIKNNFYKCFNKYMHVILR